MRSYWTSRRRTTPWTGTGAWTSWQYTAWAPGKSGFSECTGAGLTWCKSLKGKTPPLHGFPWSDSRGTPLAQNLQRCCERRHVPLGDGGIRGGGSTRGPWVVDTEPGDIFLRRQWPDTFNSSGPATIVL